MRRCQIYYNPTGGLEQEYLAPLTGAAVRATPTSGPSTRSNPQPRVTPPTEQPKPTQDSPATAVVKEVADNAHLLEDVQAAVDEFDKDEAARNAVEHDDPAGRTGDRGQG